LITRQAAAKGIISKRIDAPYRCGPCPAPGSKRKTRKARLPRAPLRGQFKRLQFTQPRYLEREAKLQLKQYDTRTNRKSDINRQIVNLRIPLLK